MDSHFADDGMQSQNVTDWAILPVPASSPPKGRKSEQKKIKREYVAMSGKTMLPEDDNSSFNSRRFISDSIDQDNDHRYEASIETLYDMALKKAGGFGYYQRLATFIIVAGYALMGAVLYGLLFFILFPTYHCLVEGTTDLY